jgi:hypothetical protein
MQPRAESCDLTNDVTHKARKVSGRRDKVGLPTTIGKALEAKGNRTASRVFGS